MVATRHSMRTDPQEEEAGAAPGGQVAMEIGTPASPMQTRSRIKRDSESEVLGDTNHEDVESTIMNLGTDLPEPTNLVMQMVTRSRRRSGQSDGDVSEAESNCSSHSTRMTRSRPVLSYLTDSARKLRSHRSGVVTEPIMESIEDGELSEAESNCSSVSTRAMRRQTGTSSSLGTTRSRRSVLASEPIPEVKEDAEVSEVESNCSSVSGVQDIKHTRFTRSRKSIVKCPPPLLLSQTEDISDAESCSSGISAHPIARNVTRSMKCKSKPEEDESASKTRKDVDQELEKSRKQSNTLRGVIVSEPLGSERSSSVTEQELLSSPRRSLRSRQVSQHKDVMIVAVIEPQRMEHSKENTSGNDGKSKERETPMKMGNVSYEESLLASPTKSTFQSTKNVPGQIDVAEVKTGSANSTAECKEVEQQSTSTSNEATFTLVINSDDSDDKISEGSSDLDEVNLQGSNVPYHDRSGIVCKEVKRGNIISLLDSDESEDSEHSDVDAHEVTHKDGKEKDYNEDLVENREPQEILHQPSEDSQNDCLFVIDTAPGLDADKKYYVDHEDDDDDDDDAESEDESEMEEPSQPVTEEDDFIDEDEDAELLNKPKRGFVLSTSIDPGLNIKDMGGLYITFDAEKPNPGPSLLKKMKERENKKKEELLQKSVITPDFEQKESVPPYKESVNKLKKQRREEREKTTGQGWFDMKAPEITEELKNDLKALKMRSAMDPKRFYKKNDRDAFPKYFQVGTVVDSPVDFYHSRIPKKQRKRTIVEELLADSEFRRYNKKKYQEIIAEKAALAEGKKNRKKKKFKK